MYVTLEKEGKISQEELLIRKVETKDTKFVIGDTESKKNKKKNSKTKFEIREKNIFENTKKKSVSR